MRDKLLCIFNDELARDLPLVLVEMINQVTILDESGHPETQGIFDYLGVINAQLLLPKDQADHLEDLFLKILEIYFL